LAEGRDAAATRLGEEEAMHLVLTRPQGILDDRPVEALPPLPERSIHGARSALWRRWFAGA
jgi:protein-tyrosine phosphatase